MGRGDTSERSPEGAAQRGLWRLMLKLPAQRGHLQILGRRDPLASLCEAYEDASVTLDRLRNIPGETDRPMVKEYETICSEIETDVIQYCLQHRGGVPE
jgi:hypothetical protein